MEGFLMKSYNDLTSEQKLFFSYIEYYIGKHPNIHMKDLVEVLESILNKYKGYK
jgi:hypothetical protein